MAFIFLISYLICVFAIADAVEFNISYGIVNSIILPEGDQVVTMTISGIQESYSMGDKCEGWCTENKDQIDTSKCESSPAGQEKVLKVELKQFKVTPSHSGNWTCILQFSSGNVPDLFQNLNVSIKEQDTPPLIETWVLVAVVAGALVLLVIIGQTICILYFKAKAKKAAIVKNLTRTKSGSDSLTDMRYVKNDNKCSVETVRDSIYEALDTVRDRAPIPPPIETLPVPPKSLGRSVSTQHLVPKPEAGFSRTNPRPQKQQQNQTKFNTVSSLERIKNRPPEPLPTPEEIYEVMTPGASPEPMKASRFNKGKPEKSPLLACQNLAPVPNQRMPKSPALGRKPPIEPSPGPSRRPMMPPGQSGHPIPGQMLRPPISPGLTGQSGKPPAGAMATMGPMPMVPSMISKVNLKPVKHIAKKPVEEPSRTAPGGIRKPPGLQSDGPRATPGAFRMPLADGPRVTPDAFRIPLADGPRMTPGPKMLPGGSRMAPGADQVPVPPYKPKPPLPDPEQEQNPVEPSNYPESYNNSSDEEFDCYDVLPEYRIYGNAPLKKI